MYPRFRLLILIALLSLGVLSISAAQGAQQTFATGQRAVFQAAGAVLEERSGVKPFEDLARGFLVAEGIQGESEEQMMRYAVRTPEDKKWDYRWCDGRYDLVVTMSPSGSGETRVGVVSKIEGYLAPFYLLTRPPMWLGRESKGVLEQEILNAIEDKLSELRTTGKITLHPRPTAQPKPYEPGILSAPNAPWTANVNAVVNDSTTTNHQNETSVAVKGDTIYVSWNDYRGKTRTYAGFARSTNRGTTWTNQFIGNYASTSQWGYDTYVNLGRGDTVYVCVERYNSSVRDSLYRSPDAGNTWLAPVDFGTIGSVDKCYGDADPPYLYHTYTDFASGAVIRFSRSTNGGSSFSSAVAVDRSSNTSQGSQPRAGRGDTLYVVWGMDDRFTSGWTTNFDVFVRRSPDRGATWPDTERVIMRCDNNYGIFRWRHLPMPAFDVNRQNGDLYVANADADSTAPRHFRMKFTRSTDAGMTWSPQVRLDAPAGADTFSAIFPWIEVSPGVPPTGGRVYVTWISTKGGNSNLGCFGRVSTDRGVTFLPEEQISDTLVRPDSLPSGSFAVIIGDYIGCRATNTYIAAAWCDNRNQTRSPSGREDVYVSTRLHPSGIEEGRSVFASAFPIAVELLPAQPNPAGGRVTLRYGLPREENVLLQVYDLTGHRVRTLADGPQTAGYHTALWDGRNHIGRLAPSGVYFYRLQAGSESKVGKLVLAR